MTNDRISAEIAIGPRSMRDLESAKKKKSRAAYSRWRQQARESKLYLCTLFVLANGQCPQCGVDMYIDFIDSHGLNKATLDHVNPISKTMEHNKLNLQIMCSQCNNSKADKVDNDITGA